METRHCNLNLKIIDGVAFLFFVLILFASAAAMVARDDNSSIEEKDDSAIDTRIDDADGCKKY